MDIKRLQKLLPNRLLSGRYNVIRQLGAGGFSQTFLAKDTQLPGQPLCVVKQLKPQINNATRWDLAKRLFDTEAAVLYQLGNHDQIPRLLAHFEDNREFYLVQEFVEGGALDRQLLPGHPWSQLQVMRRLHDLLSILHFVHQQNVIHRDIKPSNLICRQVDDKLVMIDFGAVKQVSAPLLDETDHTTTISIGTQGYMPSEQISGNPRFNSDLYAAGIIGIQALTGIRPSRLQRDLISGEILWHNPEIAVLPEFADILDRLVRYHFRDRYQTAAEPLAALEQLLAGQPEVKAVKLEESELIGSTILWSPAPPEELTLDPSSEPPNSEHPPQPHSDSAQLPTEADPIVLPPKAPVTDVPKTAAFAVNQPPITELNQADLNQTQASASPLHKSIPASSIEPAASLASSKLPPDHLPTDHLPTDHSLTDHLPTDHLLTDQSDSGHTDAIYAFTDRIPANLAVPPTEVLQPNQPITANQGHSTLRQTSHSTLISSRAAPWLLLVALGGVITASVLLSRPISPGLQTTATPASPAKPALPTMPCREPPPPPLPSNDPNYEYPDGARYYGLVENQRPADGRATMVFSNGNRYDGEFQAGQRNGCGTYSFANGKRYIGQFKADRFEGLGIWLLGDGDRYVGAFKDNRCHGEGIFLFKDGRFERGTWQNGKLANGGLSCDR